MTTAEQHDVIIRWQQQGQAAVAAEANKIKSSFGGLGSSLTKSLSGASASIKKSLAGISAQAKQVGTVMSVGVTAPLVAMAKGAIDAASDLNESMSAVQTVFGSSADEVIKFSSTAATSLGQSQQAALSAASGMGALFQSIGLSNTEMADFSKNLLTASADLGSFFNQDPTEVLNALRSGLVGEAEPLRKFGILLNETAVNAEGVRLGLINVGDEMNDQQKVQARYSLIMSQIGAATGDFARTSDGLANSQRILAAEVQDLSADIGGLLLPYAKEAVNTFKNVVAWVKALSPEMKDLGVKIGLVAAAAGPVLLVLGQIGPVLAALASGPFVLAAGAAVALYKAWDTNFLGIRDILQTFMGNVGTVVGRIVQFFTHAKDRGLDPFDLAIRTMIQGFKTVLGDDNPVLEFLRGILRNGRRLADYIDTDLKPKIGELFTALTTGDFSGAADIFSTILTDIQGGWNKTIGPWIDERVAQFKALPATAVQGIADSFAHTNWTIVGDAVGQAAKSGLAGLDQFSEWLFDALTGAGVGGSGGTPGNAPGGGLPAGGLASQLGIWVRGQVQQVNWNSVHDALNAGMKGEGQNANAITDFATWANQAGIDLHTKIAEFVNGEIPNIDWTTANDLLSTAGADLLGQVLQGFGNKMPDISAWFGGGETAAGGDAQSFGTKIYNMVTSALASAKDDITASGASVLGWFIDGLNAKWTELEQWFHDHNPGSLVPSGWFNINPDTSTPPADPHAGRNAGISPEMTPKAYGGLGRGWAWVGEAGPELVKLPRGAMVIPHGAAQSRALMEGARRMAMGGVTGDWQTWVQGLSRAQRANLREARLAAGGHFSRDERANLLDAAGMGYDLYRDSRYDVAAGGRPRPPRAEDRTRVPDDFYGRGDIHVYGNVTINPPDGDAHAAISRQFQTRNR